MSTKKIATCNISHRPSVVSRVRCAVCRVSCYLTCPLSRVSLFCVSCPGSQTVTPFFFDGLKKCRHKVISAQCPECQSDVNSNKRGCGTNAQAQASARVDVPTARVFPAWTMESNMSASFCTNGWICACQATDRDLESVFVKRKVNAWICAQSATDRDLESFNLVRR